ALEELREAQESLARAERLAAVGELSAAVAHGIRNPLAGIRLAAQLALEQTAPDSPVHENLQDVLVEVDKLEAHVRGILDFTRPFEPRVEPTHLPALIEGLLRTLAPRLDAGGVTVELDVPADLPLVRADPTHLGQALQELVVNAMEATGAGGRITISAAAAGNGLGRVRGTCGVAVAVPLPALHVAPPERADVRGPLAAACGAGVGAPERRLRSPRASAQLRGDGALTSRAWGEEAEASRRPHSRERRLARLRRNDVQLHGGARDGAMRAVGHHHAHGERAGHGHTNRAPFREHAVARHRVAEKALVVQPCDRVEALSSVHL